MKLVQAASFNYDMLYKVARAISDEVRAKVRAGVCNEGRGREKSAKCLNKIPLLFVLLRLNCMYTLVK